MSDPAPKTVTTDDVVAPRLALSMTEATKAIGVSRQTMYAMLHRGEIRTRRLGSRRVVAVAELERFLAARSSAPIER